MRRRLFRVLVISAVVTVMVFGSAGAAFAGLDDDLTGVSSTHPNSGDAAWRQGWGNKLPFHVAINAPTEASGFIYRIDRDPVTVIDTSLPHLYARSTDRAGALFNQSFDIAGALELNPAFDGTLLYPGMASMPVEGLWAVHTVMYSVSPTTGAHVYSTNQGDWFLGVDKTPPAKPTGVKVYPSELSTVAIASGGVLPRTSGTVRWDYLDYDALSGTALFNCYVDGKKVVGLDSDGVKPVEKGAVWYGPGGFGAVTLENLAPGKRTIQISAVDRATNESAKTALYSVWVDPDSPTVTVNKPTDGGLLGVKPTLSALVKDLGGVKSVNFKVDSKSVGTITLSTPATSYTANKTVDLSSFAAGTHTLTVTATDVAGRSVAKTVSFKLDKTAPSLSITSRGPNPFYPRKRDGYKDNYVVKFNTNEACKAYLYVYNSKGKLYRTVSKSVNPGSNSLVWNGKSASGGMAAGTFGVKVVLVDAAGNARSSSKYSATIRFYEVKRISSSRVKIIQR